MKNMRRVWLMGDGSITIIVPAWNDVSVGFNSSIETEEKFYDRKMLRIEAAAPEAPATVLGDVDVVTLPYTGSFPSRNYKAARGWDGSKVVVDMPRARTLKMAWMRKDRDQRLAETDIEVAKLDGSAIPSELRAKRVALRDFPAVIELDLSAIIDVIGLEEYEPVWP